VLGTAINKYCYITIRTLRPSSSTSIGFVYSRIELVKASTTSFIRRCAPCSASTDRAGIEIIIRRFAGALGLGSSSSFTTGLLNALFALQGR